MSDGNIATLACPIDVMLLIHKALSAEAAKVQSMAESLEPGAPLQPLRLAFNEWAAQLMYHAEVEDRLMTGPMDDFPPARTTESEHQVLGRLESELNAYIDSRSIESLETPVRDAIKALHEAQHVVLMEKLEEVLGVLNDEVRKTRLVARTKRHIFGKIVELRIAQDDHFESEEAFILPEVRVRMSNEQQARIAHSLLLDEESDTPDWVMHFIGGAVSPSEAKLLEAFTERLTAPVKELGMDGSSA